MLGSIRLVGNGTASRARATRGPRPGFCPTGAVGVLLQAKAMPELPEVEVVRKGLQERLPGAIVRRVEVRASALRWPVPQDLPELLRGRAPLAVERRGKYLMLRFPEGCLIVHLGMSGTLRSTVVSNNGEAAGRLKVEALHILGVATPQDGPAAAAVAVTSAGSSGAAQASAASGTLRVTGLDLAVGEELELQWSLAPSN